MVVSMVSYLVLTMVVGLESMLVDYSVEYLVDLMERLMVVY
jgi:hypothetical protein